MLTLEKLLCFFFHLQSSFSCTLLLFQMQRLFLWWYPFTLLYIIIYYTFAETWIHMYIYVCGPFIPYAFNSWTALYLLIFFLIYLHCSFLSLFFELVCLVGLMHVDANPAQTKKTEKCMSFWYRIHTINVCAAACLADGSNKPHLKTTQHHQHIRFVWSLQINLKWVAWNRCFKKAETAHTISNLKLEFFRNFSTLCCVVTNIPQNEILLQFAIQKIVSVPDENQE